MVPLRMYLSMSVGRECPFPVRLATPADIPAIAACNRATLPENYDAEFYHQQLS